jgi:alpha/beta superfamily hydrolase
MVVDINDAEAPSAFALLLHPHPNYGGDRFHPLIDTLFTRLPGVSMSAIRFDFSTAGTAEARDEVIAVINLGAERWPELSAIVAGYSFGAGIAATVDDQRIAGWYLVAPPSAMLVDAPIGDDPRPKAVVVPEYDQFSPPRTVEHLIGGWRSTTMSILADTDHFLGVNEPVVDQALSWITSIRTP